MRVHSVNHPMLLMEEQYIYIYIYNCIWLEVEKIEVLVELSTYLFVCVLRRSFTSISKISFWLKLDFNLSANAVMLLKKHHGGIMFLAFSVCFGLHMTVQCLLFGFMSSSGHFMSCTTSHPHSLCCAMVVRTLC